MLFLKLFQAPQSVVSRKSLLEKCSDFAAAMTRVPAWLKRPAGASFGFGGKLVSCINEKQRGNLLSVRQVISHCLQGAMSIVSEPMSSAWENQL